MDTDNTDANTPEEEKENIEAELEEHAEDIVEPDEAADSAEGMNNLEDNMFKDVEEDRDATTDPAADIPAPNIIR